MLSTGLLKRSAAADASKFKKTGLVPSGTRMSVRTVYNELLVRQLVVIVDQHR